MGEIKHEEYFINEYVQEVFELEHVCTSTKWLRTILGDKYWKIDINQLIKDKYQNWIEK